MLGARGATWLALPLLCLAACLSCTSAHMRLTFPTPRDQQSGMKSGPCQYNPSYGVVTTLNPGPVEITSYETINHPGAPVRLSLAPIAAADQDDWCGLNTNILAYFPHNPSGYTYRMPIEIPDVRCDNCTLQLVQVMTDKNQYSCNGTQPEDWVSYYSCANVRINGSIPIEEYDFQANFTSPDGMPSNIVPFGETQGAAGTYDAAGVFQGWSAVTHTPIAMPLPQTRSMFDRCDAVCCAPEHGVNCTEPVGGSAVPGGGVGDDDDDDEDNPVPPANSQGVDADTIIIVGAVFIVVVVMMGGMMTATSRRRDETGRSRSHREISVSRPYDPDDEAAKARASMLEDRYEKPMTKVERKRARKESDRIAPVEWDDLPVSPEEEVETKRRNDGAKAVVFAGRRDSDGDDGGKDSGDDDGRAGKRIDDGDDEPARFVFSGKPKLQIGTPYETKRQGGYSEEKFHSTIVDAVEDAPLNPEFEAEGWKVDAEAEELLGQMNSPAPSESGGSSSTVKQRRRRSRQGKAIDPGSGQRSSLIVGGGGERRSSGNRRQRRSRGSRSAGTPGDRRSIGSTSTKHSKQRRRRGEVRGSVTAEVAAAANKADESS